ncbi:MAG: plastocyanin/azurin family copper-binding protein [Zetaproteobacteria bacterium]|nr:plastocyanin/azurin family copper-binding protein [Zetaproteobacteria bacterium]
MKRASILLAVGMGSALMTSAGLAAKKTASDKQAQAKEASKAVGTEVVINLSTKGNDIAFDSEAIQVPFGRDFPLIFKNRAKTDSEIIHNIAILKPGSTDVVLEYFEEHDYDMDLMRKHPAVLAMTPQLEPGQTGTLQLGPKLLSKPGLYPYICLVPGHADMLGMKGVMSVIEKKK